MSNLESTIELERQLLSQARSEANSYPKVAGEADAKLFYADMALQGLRNRLQAMPLPQKNDDPLIAKYNPIFREVMGCLPDSAIWFRHGRDAAISYLTEFETNPTDANRTRVQLFLNAYSRSLN